MSRPEKFPILTSSLSAELFPPLQKSSLSAQSQAYGVIEVGHQPSPEFVKENRTWKLGKTPFVAILAIGVAAALAVGYTTMFRSEGGVSEEDILRQSAMGHPYVTIPQGELRGYHRKSRQGRDYTAFYKVPYAAPPVGKLRLRDPQPPHSWEGLRDFSEVALQCIQREKYAPEIHPYGDEDCLYANIYIPGLDPAEHSDNPLPTMVYIHGGAFVDGNGSRYGTEYFMDEDVVVVTFQYRLGPLGFLSTEDGVIRGNQGLKDQVQMLRWVRDNIKHFGGDSERVTIYGNSGGGISVAFLMLSPLANGLFHRAITQSGPSLCGYFSGQINENPRATVEEIGRVLNCPTNDSHAFLDCIETKDAGEIALVRTPPTTYGLTVEKTNDPDVFISRSPYEQLASGLVNKVPYMMGVVNAEWTNNALEILYDQNLVDELNRDFAGTVGTPLSLPNATRAELEELKNLYFGNKEIGNDTIKEMAYLMSDRMLIHCSYVGAKMHSKYAPAYLYHLTKPPYLSYVDKNYPGFPAKELGIVAHADELQFMFLYDGYPEIKVGDLEYYEYSKYIVKLWAHFAATGNPTMDGQTWDKADISESGFWFELGDKTGRTDVLDQRMAFWDKFSHEELQYVKSFNFNL